MSYKIIVEIVGETDDEQQMKTAARKLGDQCRQLEAAVAYTVRYTLKGGMSNPAPHIIQPGSPLITPKGSLSH